MQQHARAMFCRSQICPTQTSLGTYAKVPSCPCNCMQQHARAILCRSQAGCPCNCMHQYARAILCRSQACPTQASIGTYAEMPGCPCNRMQQHVRAMLLQKPGLSNASQHWHLCKSARLPLQRMQPELKRHCFLIPPRRWGQAICSRQGIPSDAQTTRVQLTHEGSGCLQTTRVQANHQYPRGYIAQPCPGVWLPAEPEDPGQPFVI
jgi:hypothetical protein